MYASSILRFIVLVNLLFMVQLPLSAENFNEGAKNCSECHDQEYNVWKDTPHFKSYKTIHKSPEAKKILKAVGGKSMKRSKDCATCHYTAVQKSASKKAKVKSGPSCESCHGASSTWRDVHNDFGGPKIKSKDEKPAHKAKRLADAEAGGMIASRMVYRIASGCMACHGLANSSVKKGLLGKMLEAGHPIEPDFEIVKYSQGKLRHRFVPPNVNQNSKLSAADTARLYLGGQAASLVSATAVKNKVDHAEFNAAQDKKIEIAIIALNAVKSSIPEAAALLGNPNNKNALAFESALQGKDLSAEVKSLLPEASSYK
jgi:hypothetical protein